MTPERWRAVQEVFAAATERAPESRGPFLEEACRGDPDLRSEVDSLLSSFRAASSGFLESPAIDAVPPLSPAQRVGPLGKGKRLGPYEILAPIGAGGMGEVYRANDPRLGRAVAIKVLPADLALEPERLRRFEKEARSASALNHPNIVTIYDIGTADGVSYIAMELVEGATLRELLVGGAFAMKRLLQIAPPIGDGLAKAHEAGIVHRDLKPENVMVTKDGRVKILDFGLAKLTFAGSGSGEGSRLPTMTGTTPGVVVGTVGYMSPEQASGAAVDFRSDQFSFGSILYEMATGKRAFSGKTAIDTLGAILNDEPPPIGEANPRAPTQLKWIVERCLSKEPRQRYSSTDDLARDLATLRDHLSEATSGGGLAAASRRGAASPRQRRLMALGLGAVLLLVLVAGALFRLTRPQPKPPPPMKVRQLTSTSAENRINGGGISPDGKYLAYTDAKRIRIQLIETGEIQAVPEPEGLKGREVTWEIGPWFPDGTKFLVNAHTQGDYEGEGWTSQGTSIWTVLLLGGPPRKVRDEAMAYTISPDASLIAFGTNKGKYGDRAIWVMAPNGDGARKLLGADENAALVGFGWFRDQQHATYLRIDASGATGLSSDLKGGHVTTVFPPAIMDRVTQVAWSPDGRVIYALVEPTPDAVNGSQNFWEIRFDVRTGKPVGETRKLTNWTGFGIGPSTLSADGKRLAFLKWTSHATIYVADLEANGTRIANTMHLTLTESQDGPEDWTADGKAVIMTSNRTGRIGIYKQPLGEDTAQLLAAGTVDLWDPRVTADGKWVLYQRGTKPGDPASPTEILRISIDGGPSQVIATAPPGSSILRARSPSNLCALAEPTENRRQIVITAIDPLKGRGAELTRLDIDPARNYGFELSPDGTRIAFLHDNDGPIRIFSLRGEAPRDISVKGWKDLNSPNWTSDGRGLFVSSGGTTILHVDFGGNAQVLWKKSGGRWCPARPSPDGRHMAMLGSTGEGNIWLMENF